MGNSTNFMMNSIRVFILFSFVDMINWKKIEKVDNFIAIYESIFAYSKISKFRSEM